MKLSVIVLKALFTACAVLKKGFQTLKEQTERATRFTPISMRRRVSIPKIDFATLAEKKCLKSKKQDRENYMKTKLIGSAQSFEALTKLASEYFFGATISLHPDGTISNLKGKLDRFKWTLKGKRYRLERIEE